ncbi:MAG: acyl-CoA dehydrogenase family protein [Deltaproteobacteria bacterium]|nr:acyl-CoA dehydrogenase family protein [Deltaproteobacteria bacterium]
MGLCFEFSEEQRMLEDSVVRWAYDWLEPQMEHMYEIDEMPPDLFKQTAGLGINGIVFEEKYGGTDMGYVETLLAYEAIARVSNALSMTVGASQTLCFDNFRRNASEEQKMEVLPKSVTGEWIGCLGITEPNAGSDAMSLATRAEKKGDRYIINGSKIFITNAPVADFFTFYAKTDPEKGPHGISAFFVKLDEVKGKGFTCEKIKKWGMRTSPTGLLTFEDMEVPEDQLIGGLNKGVAVLTSGLCTERITLCGCTLGSQRRCLEDSLRYSKERVQFKKPIASFQLIQGKLADMYCEYKASRWMAYSAAAYCDTLEDKRGGKGTDLDRLSAAALLYCGEKGTKIGLDAVQIHGGYGYCQEYGVTRHFLDQKLWEIGAGTSEVRRIIIARELMRDDFASGL